MSAETRTFRTNPSKGSNFLRHPRSPARRPATAVRGRDGRYVGQQSPPGAWPSRLLHSRRPGPCRRRKHHRISAATPRGPARREPAVAVAEGAGGRGRRRRRPPKALCGGLRRPGPGPRGRTPSRMAGPAGSRGDPRGGVARMGRRRRRHAGAAGRPPQLQRRASGGAARALAVAQPRAGGPARGDVPGGGQGCRPLRHAGLAARAGAAAAAAGPRDARAEARQCPATRPQRGAGGIFAPTAQARRRRRRRTGRDEPTAIHYCRPRPALGRRRRRRRRRRRGTRRRKASGAVGPWPAVVIAATPATLDPAHRCELRGGWQDG